MTSRFPPILADRGPYTIIVTSLGSDPSRSLIAINSRFTHGIVRTRELFSRGERQVFSGTAYEVLQEARRLRKAGVVFRIEPDYSFDVDDVELETRHEHDWR